MKGVPGNQTIVANISDSSITWLLRATKLTGLLTCFAERLMHTCMHTNCTYDDVSRDPLPYPPLSRPPAALPVAKQRQTLLSAVCIIEH